MRFVLIPALSLLMSAGVVAAADEAPRVITLKDRVFSPAELILPADRKVVITVKNDQDVAAEFESTQLNREKVIPARSETIVRLNGLKPGRYEYFDEFHPSSTGAIVVK